MKKFFNFSYIIFFTLALLSFKASAVPTFVDSYSVSSEESQPRGFTFNKDGTKMFVAGYSDDAIDEYTLSTAWDVSTASFVDSFVTKSDDEDTRDVKFNQDGTKMFVLGKEEDEVFEYTLTTGFDVSTASLVDSFVISNEETQPNELEFNSDGTKMFIMGNAGNDINEYKLSTGFDVSTASFVDSFDVSSEEGNPFGFTFYSKGTKMYVTGWTGDDINEYTLTTAFDVSTASFVGSFSVKSEDEKPTSLEFSSDGSKMFVLGAAGKDVNEYTLSCYYGVVNCTDPTSDKDDVASIEAQTESAKQLIQHTTYPVLNRMEWLRRNNNSGNLTNQNIKFQFSNEILASLSNLIIPASLSSNNSSSVELQSGNWSYWSEGTVSIGKVGDSTTSSAKNINTSAITIGADRKNDKNRMYGFAFRFGSDDIDVGNLGSALDMNAFSLTVYETRPSGENMFMDSLIGISAINTDLLNNSGSISTDGEREGKQIFASIKFRETFAKEKLNITPNIKVDLGFTSLADYTETGADGLNLKFDRQNIGTIITSIGSVIDNTIDINNGIIKPNIQLEYNADISPSSKQEFEYASNGTSYILENINSSTHNYRGSFGFDLIIDNGLSLTTNYERNQSKGNGYSDAIYFAGSYISKKDGIYTVNLEGSETFNTKLDYKRNISGFDFKVSSNYSLMSEIPDYGANITISNTF